MQKQAILVMERKNPPEKMKTVKWCRLYQLADCYLDLSFEEGEQKNLTGQILCKGEHKPTLARVRLSGPGSLRQEQEVALGERFSLIVTGLEGCWLEVTLGPHTYHVPLP